MTNKELIELSAKAAGICLAPSPWTHRGPEGSALTDEGKFWSPLTDDGDALRLAVALQLSIGNEHVNAGATYCTRGDEVFPLVNSGDVCDGPAALGVIPEDYAATRRAIVMAAAEIGKAMP